MFDIFGLGATIYLLCTGELPDLANYRPMGELRPGAGFPPELEALVAAAVAVLPEDRLATAIDFQRRLDEIRAAHVEESSPFLFEDCYELLELLGSGAKGDVYRAYHRDAANALRRARSLLEAVTLSPGDPGSEGRSRPTVRDR